MSPTGTEPLGLSLDVSAIPAQAVGVGRYVLELVDALERRDDVALTLWCRSDDATRWSQDGAPRSVRPLAPKPRPLRLLWEQTALGRLVDASGASVHHSPHYTMPERTKVPCVVTVHDLTFFDHPEWHERTKVPVFRRAVRVAARRARALMCDSEKTARRLEEVCRPEGRVVVVPLGVDLRRFNPVAGDDDEGVLASLGVRRPYVLFLGTLEPRKSVPELVGAFDVVASSRTELSLVLAGRPGWGISEIERALERARHAGRDPVRGAAGPRLPVRTSCSRRSTTKAGGRTSPACFSR